MPQTQVYPRWRGEHISSRTRASFRLGLSPLARGTHTPLSNSCDLPTVYPRWRGEHIDPEQQYAQTDGLSPLARGTLPYRLPDIIFLRFIPAGAGNTYKTRTHPPRGAVYPRWRGEHTPAALDLKKGRGLSPLARGTRRDYSKEDAGDRFIPAGAGNTGSVCGSIAGGAGNTVDGEFFIAGAPVYPRWRGEHKICCKTRCKNSGLSPLARGTPPPVRLTPAQRRFIPAGAGNTSPMRVHSVGTPVYPRWRGEHSKHNLLLINDFLSQSQSTNFIVSHKQHIHYVKEHLIH